MGMIELVWQRRKKAVWDFVYAGLALFLAGFWMAPLLAEVK